MSVRDDIREANKKKIKARFFGTMPELGQVEILVFTSCAFILSFILILISSDIYQKSSIIVKSILLERNSLI